MGLKVKRDVPNIVQVQIYRTSVFCSTNQKQHTTLRFLILNYGRSKFLRFLFWYTQITLSVYWSTCYKSRSGWRNGYRLWKWTRWAKFKNSGRGCLRFTLRKYPYRNHESFPSSSALLWVNSWRDWLFRLGKATSQILDEAACFHFTLMSLKR